MTNKIQKVETEIMDCWRVVDDVDVLLQYFGDDEFFTGMKPEHADKIMNLMLGVKELYSVKFERLWRAYEESLGEYYDYEKEALRSRNTIDSMLSNLEAMFKDEEPVADERYSQTSEDLHDSGRRLNDASPEEWDRVTFR
jgi:hypothetical protein